MKIDGLCCGITLKGVNFKVTEGFQTCDARNDLENCFYNSLRIRYSHVETLQGYTVYSINYGHGPRMVGLLPFSKEQFSLYRTGLLLWHLGNYVIVPVLV